MRTRALIASIVLIVALIAVGACGEDDEDAGRSDAAGASTSSQRQRTDTSAASSSTTTMTATSTTAAAVTTTTAPRALSRTAADGNLMVEASVAAGVVAPSEFVDFGVRVVDSDAGRVRVIWDFGDGTQTRLPAEPAACATRPSTRAVDTVDRQRHAYRYPGSYRAVVEVVTGAQQCLSQPATERVSLQFEVRVQDGAVHSNGPEGSDVRFVQDGEAEDNSVRMFASALENDGYLVRAVVDWGDGSPLEIFERTTKDCHDPDRSWPESSWSPSPLVHRYQRDDTFPITITFTSAGCDGEDEQSTVTVAEADSRHSPS